MIKIRIQRFTRSSLVLLLLSGLQIQMAVAQNAPVLQPGHASLQDFILPDIAPSPADNVLTKERIALGKKLFFDPRLSGDNTISCATCHNPSLGWSDGLPTGIGFNGTRLARATPTIINAGFNAIQMWDGRAKTLEDQALGPMEAKVEMNSDFAQVFDLLKTLPEYSRAFADAYPGEGINKTTLAKALAAFERTVVSNNSPFDRWVKGDAYAMTEQQIRGLAAFLDPKRGNCAACHSGANFTDDGFHSLGLPSAKNNNPDLGRFAQKPIGILKGAFKTPTLRDVELTAPYFHDGSAETLEAVVKHYVDGPVAGVRVSPNFTNTHLNDQEQADVVAFMRALTSDQKIASLPE